MFFQDCKNDISSFELECFFVRLKAYIQIFPFFLDFLQSTFNFVLLSGDITSVVDYLSVTNEIFLDIHFIECKFLTFWINIEMTSEFIPMSNSNERFSEVFDEWEDSLKVFDRWFKRGYNTPFLYMGLFAKRVQFIHKVFSVLFKHLSVNFLEFKVFNFLDIFLIPFFL